MVFKSGISPESVKAAEEIARVEYERNPIRYAWDAPSEGFSTMLKTGTGNSLESAMFVADLCGAYILFGEEQIRVEYDMALEHAGDAQDDSLTRLSRAFAELEFEFLNAVSLDFTLDLRRDGRLHSLRTFLLRLWDNVSAGNFSRDSTLYAAFEDELKEEYRKYRAEWADISKALARDFTVAAIGSGLAVLSGQMGFRVAGGGVAALGIDHLLKSYGQRSKQSRLPLGVFFDLEKRARKRR